MTLRILAIAVTIGFSCAPAWAQFTNDPIRIGVLTDLSGPFSDSNGRGSVQAVRMAVEEAGGNVVGHRIEVISADMGTTVDQGVAIARRWIDQENVAAIVDVPNSAVGLAISDFIRSRNRTFLASGPATTRLTGQACSPNTVQWTNDTYAVARAAVRAMSAAGYDTWFFITADYVLGHDLQASSTQMVEQLHGKILGSAVHPFNNADFASQIVSAQGLRPKVVALADGPTDAGNVLKQAAEFGMMRPGGPHFVTLGMTPLDVLAVGQDTIAGVSIVGPFYWDLNDGTRAFSKRFAARMNGRMPVFSQAGAYSVTVHYLKALAMARTDAGDAVVRAMKAIPVQDEAFGSGSVRIDGRHLAPFYVWDVKPRSEGRSDQDILSLRETVPADQAYRPLKDGGCHISTQ